MALRGARGTRRAVRSGPVLVGQRATLTRCQQARASMNMNYMPLVYQIPTIFI